MQQTEFKEFCELLDHISEQYGKPLSAGAKMLYWQGLIEFDLSSVKEALGRHLRNPDNGMFMPKIADVVRMLQGTSQDSALIAWAKVDKAVRHVGTGQSVVFDDPIIHRVLQEMGGWLSLGVKTNDEWPFVAKEFENRYRGYKMRNEKFEYVPKMIGLYDHHNTGNGFKENVPILIGNPEKANQVMLGGTNKPLIGFTPLSDYSNVLQLKNSHTN